MSTKERILDAALKLFNDYGTDSITVRHIAKEVGISHGNLCYHFANTDEIIYKLYENLVAELNIGISKIQVREVDLWLIYHTTRVTFTLLHKYRFLMLDFVGVMRRMDKIKQHYRELVRYRKIEFATATRFLIEGGYLKPPVTEDHYEAISEINFILGDFWIARAEIIFEGSEKDKINYYLSLIFAPMIPCFTEKGMEQYQEIQKEIKQ